MLDNIKSSYIFKIILDYINIKIKLKIIKYNKALQNKIDIQLLNYKLFSGRYLIYEQNGIGKEYNSYNNELVFEGEYKNAKRNGKGKEYNYDGKLIFEGEYLNGEKNGKGKEYFYNEHSLFEEENLNFRIGKRKEYNFYRKKYGKRREFKENIKIQIIFEGQYLNGKRWNGNGFDKNNNILYELKNGKGLVKEYINELIFFDGEYLNGE